MKIYLLDSIKKDIESIINEYECNEIKPEYKADEISILFNDESLTCNAFVFVVFRKIIQMLSNIDIETNLDSKLKWSTEKNPDTLNVLLTITDKREVVE